MSEPSAVNAASDERDERTITPAERARAREVARMLGDPPTLEERVSTIAEEFSRVRVSAAELREAFMRAAGLLE